MPTSNKQQADSPSISWADKCFRQLQMCLPQHTLSKLMHRLCRCRWPWLKNALIRFVVRQYDVDMREAAEPDVTQYEHFNAFFTRELKPEIRPLASSQLVSPVDGAISQIGPITGQTLVQAKGRDYSLKTLLAGQYAETEIFEGGQFATIYLSPRDYHRIHMPCRGQLQKMRYVPGQLFSVNPSTVRSVPDLFARNERLICWFETDFGPMALILVGAIFVGSMQTVWESGEITPPYGKKVRNWLYDTSVFSFEKGAEMGRFNMGSTVILLLPKTAPVWLPQLVASQSLRLGDALTE
ncbi:archaetidylserine decarboxylase [Methylophaga frappieri]|uniref:archaetidylserine decarboxylase n=1 Tax=Methylophaga frappieri (strain ATCC BAA-2434 / DSM 25690 / JAM7) TaxID=754477 RepID=UPI001EE67E1E|nr:archaetidylserine decarboxylase [Methylophaga frappieri]